MPYKDIAKRRRCSVVSQRKRREEHIRKGLCYICNQPAMFGRYCLLHHSNEIIRKRGKAKNLEVRKRKQEHDRARYYKYKLENKCVRCGVPLDEESRVGFECVNCYTNHNRWGS